MIYGYLSLIDLKGTPYGVPLNYVFDEGKNAIIIHCALSGRKLDGLKNTPEVSFCVVGQTSVVPDQLTCLYQSVIVQGKASIIEDSEEKSDLAHLLCAKYAPGRPIPDLKGGLARSCWIRIQIESMSVKGDPAHEFAP